MVPPTSKLTESASMDHEDVLRRRRIEGSKDRKDEVTGREQQLPLNLS